MKTVTDAREHVLSLLLRHSYRHADEEVYVLVSGRKSDTYIDCKPTTMRREAARSIAAVFEPHLPAEARAIGGLTAGADPIAYAVRDLCEARALDAFMVRKEAKKHGQRRAIEGPVAAGMPVVVVDDVVTTGGSTIRAIEQCRAEDLRVAAVVVLVDREEGGLEEIVKTVGPGIPVTAIFTKSELHARWLAERSGAAAGSSSDVSLRTPGR